MNRRTKRWSWRVAAAVATIAALVGACAPTAVTMTQVSLGPALVASPSPSATAASDPATTGVPAGFESWYGQEVTWSTCALVFQCATVEAPLSWQDPAAGSISLALKRYQATGSQRLGSLLINPGGPGAPGTDLVQYAPALFGAQVLASYDVVGFDPRGVGGSSAIECEDDRTWDDFLATSVPSGPDSVDALRDQFTELGEACEERNGVLLGEVDTVSAARDMDLIRAVLGDAQLNYLGYSYGTALGHTYAALFPQTVGRMVLDGALDLTLSASEVVIGQATGFEQALRAYVTDCLAGEDCPLSGTVDEGLAQIRALLDSLVESPLPTSDSERPLTWSLGFYGVVYPLYSRSLWPSLSSALATAIENEDGTALLANADAYSSRLADGSYADNSGQVFYAINCLDSRQDPSPEAMEAEAAELDEVAPTLGVAFAYGAVTCENWPVPQVSTPLDLSAPGAAPILVVGTTGDPATPYVWAQEMAKTLSSGVLLTYDGEGHTAYGNSNQCVMDTVDSYLVDGEVPASGTVC